MPNEFKKPQTIEELLDFCQSYQMPLEKMRFFIGEDYLKPKAFGIFQDANGEFVVYKNKANGERFVKYQGPNEKKAVSILYEKLKSEVELRRKKYGVKTSKNAFEDIAEINRVVRKRKRWMIIIVTAVMILAGVQITRFFIKKANTPDKGYYQYNHRSYYYNGSSWFTHTDAGWVWTPDEDVVFDLTECFLSDDYEDAYDIADFSLSPYETSDDRNVIDYDDGGFWDNFDFGGWDAGDTNWDTDW